MQGGTRMENETRVSNTPDNDSVVIENPNKKTEDHVSYETHAKLLKQRKADQDRSRVLEEKIALFEKQQKDGEEKTLVEQEQWKKLADNYKTEAQKAVEERDELQGKVTSAVKMHAFMSKLPGKIKNPAYKKFIPVDQIIIDPSTGEVDENSLSQTVEGFMSEHGKSLVELTGEKRKMPSVPTTTTTNTNNGDNKNDIAATLKDMLSKKYKQ